MVMINGTIVNYYFHCKRQCWLHAHKINLEDNSEDVHIGRILHELKDPDNKNKELALDNIKLDKITKQYLVEVKKSDADVGAALQQIKYYLKKLKDKGICRNGKLEFIEKNKQDKTIHIIELTEDLESEIEMTVKEIEMFLETDKAPMAVKTNKCKKCAYYEYCFI